MPERTRWTALLQLADGSVVERVVFGTDDPEHAARSVIATWPGPAPVLRCFIVTEIAHVTETAHVDEEVRAATR